MDSHRPGDRLPGVALAGAVTALACCAALPAAVALIGGLTAAALAGIAAGVVALGSAVAVIALAAHARHRRGGAPTTEGSDQ